MHISPRYFLPLSSSPSTTLLSPLSESNKVPSTPDYPEKEEKEEVQIQNKIEKNNRTNPPLISAYNNGYSTLDKDPGLNPAPHLQHSFMMLQNLLNAAEAHKKVSSRTWARGQGEIKRESLTPNTIPWGPLLFSTPSNPAPPPPPRILSDLVKMQQNPENFDFSNPSFSPSESAHV